jgi:hypothetical protein
MRKFITTATVEVDVDIHSDDLDDDTLRKLCQESNVFNAFNEGAESLGNDIDEMFWAFKLSRDGRALELARKIAQDHTGRIL